MAILRGIGLILQFIWRALDGVRKVLHLVLLLCLLAIYVAATNPTIPLVPEKAALVIAPQGTLVEELSGDPISRRLGHATGDLEDETLLRDLTEALNRAKDDKRITMVVLDLTGLTGGGLAKLRELGFSLEEFRKGGKRIIALGEYYDQPQFYLASYADEIYLDPMGFVLIDGYDRFRTYYREVIDKLLIDVNVFKVGEFKSAPDEFERKDMSPEEREESSVWLGELWGQYQADVGRRRKLPEGALTSYANNFATTLKSAGGDTAKVALNLGLVTGIETRPAVEGILKGSVGADEATHSFNQVSVDEYLQATRAEPVLGRHSDNKVAIVVASGEILDGYHAPGTIGGDSTSELLRDARYDDDVKAVVLRIDSPGGSVFASEEIYREVQALRQAGKPVVASMSSVAASGGYYIAAGADQIFASPGTITGSIGIYAVVPTFERTLEKLGVHTDGVGTTNLSGQFRLDRSLSPDARAVLQLVTERGYHDFLARVAEGRKRKPEEIDAIARGRVWSGQSALKIGLIDHLGSLKQAVTAAAGLAHVQKDYEVKWIQREITWREAFLRRVEISMKGWFEDESDTQAARRFTRRVTDPLTKELARLGRFSEPMRAYAYCPCTVD
ncbi:MAG: signal peptide peptidase SppA [Steroidobacteraceae bacterium]